MLATFIRKQQDTPTDWSFFVKAPPEFNYKAGQYSVIRLALAYEDPRGNARTCSTSSSPTEEYVRFTFTIRDTGFKKTLMELPENSPIELFPPKGKMILEEVTSTHCIMVAGGIGVAPYRGIAKFAYDTQVKDKKLTLIYCDKTIEEIAFKNEFDQIATTYPNFNVIYTLTRHELHHGEWEGLQGRIDQEFITHHIDMTQQDTQFMVCGPVPMVQDTLQHLYNLHVPREKIIAELFTGY